MASNDFIRGLIAELQSEGVKSAADDDDKAKKTKDDDKDKHKKDEKGERENAFRERMKGKKDKDKDEDDKKKSAGALPVLDGSLLADLESLPEDLRKLASARATASFLADMARSQTFGGAPAAPALQEPTKEAAAGFGQEQPFDASDLFNQVFELHTAKLASLDPEFAAILEHEQTKMAFNQGFEDTVLELQAQLGVNPFAALGA